MTTPDVNDNDEAREYDAADAALRHAVRLVKSVDQDDADDVAAFVANLADAVARFDRADAAL